MLIVAERPTSDLSQCLLLKHRRIIKSYHSWQKGVVQVTPANSAGVCACCKGVGEELDTVQPTLHCVGVSLSVQNVPGVPEPMHPLRQILHT